MTHVLTVALYEFQRVFKVKDVVVSLAVMVLLAVGAGACKKTSSPETQNPEGREATTVATILRDELVGALDGR